MYSTIKKKRCKCSLSCKLYPNVGWEGYAANHAPIDLKMRMEGKTKRQRSESNKRKLNKVKSLYSTDVNLEGVVKHMIKGELQEWFNFHMSISPMRCENCNTSLKHYNRLDWYGSQHHIIEKHLCPSVGTVLENHMVLGKWCCHSQWHTNYTNAQKMPCFPLAVERFKLFKDRIALNEVRKIPDCFLLPINQAVSGQCPNNQNSKDNEGEDAYNFTINRSNVTAEQVDYQIKNSNDN